MKLFTTDQTQPRIHRGIKCCLCPSKTNNLKEKHTLAIKYDGVYWFLNVYVRWYEVTQDKSINYPVES